MNKILVTGGAGYIGSHTIIELIENTNYTPISIDNFSRSHKSTLNRIKKLTNKDVLNYEVNLCDLEDVESVFKENTDIVGDTLCRF
jgi:UDP-glucose 4-epimerase